MNRPEKITLAIWNILYEEMAKLLKERGEEYNYFDIKHSMMSRLGIEKYYIFRTDIRSVIKASKSVKEERVYCKTCFMMLHINNVHIFFLRFPVMITMTDNESSMDATFCSKGCRSRYCKNL